MRVDEKSRLAAKGYEDDEGEQWGDDCGEEENSGYLCYKIEMMPKPDAGVVWGKVIMWVSKEGYMQLRADYYDEDEYPHPPISILPAYYRC